MKKKILIVINTLSRAGAEMALLELLKLLAEDQRVEVQLLVLLEQGELIAQLPDGVTLVNRRYHRESVLETKGKKWMYTTIIRDLFCRGNLFRLLPYMLRALYVMKKNHQVQMDKLLWRAVADGAQRLSGEYDLAIAFLEGGSAYYVADHVRARKKAAMIHIDYTKAGYFRELDRDCYLQYDRIFPIGENVKTQFLKVYPQLQDRTIVFPNVVNQSCIRKKARCSGGFTDRFDGIRILTVGRLTEQKAYPVAIKAMRLLKEKGVDARWYVLGEGPERGKLERLIAQEGLQKEFLLLGAVENPYPYYAQADIYVHATRYEGKSIAIQEAQTLGCAIVVAESSAEQVRDGVDGTVCILEASAVAEAVLDLIQHPKKRQAYQKAAAGRKITCEKQLGLLEELLWEKTSQKNC